MVQKKKTRAILLGAAVATGGAVLLNALFLEHVLFDKKIYRIGSKEHDGERPDLRFVLVSDLHFRDRLSLKYRKLVKAIRKLNPDLLLLAGDSVDREGKLEPFEKFLRLLPADLPKVAVPGNHDYSSESMKAGALAEIFERCNGRLLVNESKVYEVKGHRVVLSGIDDLLQGNPDFEQVVKGIGHEPNHLMLIHSPEHYDIISERMSVSNKDKPDSERLNIRYFFAGHNHGGQVKLGNYAPVQPPKSGDYLQGWYGEAPPYLYLSKGFGTSRLPVRFNSRAEITVLEYTPF